MNTFYTCPRCKGADFNWVGYPHIYCRHCKSYEVVQAMSYAGIDRMLDDMDVPFYSKENSHPLKPTRYVLTHQPMYKKQDNSNSGVGRGIEVGQKDSLSHKANKLGGF